MVTQKDAHTWLRRQWGTILFCTADPHQVDAVLTFVQPDGQVEGRVDCPFSLVMLILTSLFLINFDITTN